MRLDPTRLPDNSILVRFFFEGEKTFSSSVIVSESEDGKVLTLYGLSPGSPFSSAVWRKAKAELFPEAEEIRWERRKEGVSSWRTLRLT